MATLREQDEKTARKKGFTAAAATAGAVTLGVVVAPVLGVVAAIPAAYLGYDWFMFRAKRGMRL